MSSKSTIFLTEDNEHFYQDGNEPHYKDGELIGYTLVLEMSKRNINILLNDNDDLVIEITNPESELYTYLMKMQD